ncbi:MAG: UDP-GlcNAc--UDP-phosphate GlcNAc-1-phosphate transferase [Cyclobacteriaceae bacterium]
MKIDLWTSLGIASVLLVVAEFLYFKIAERFKIIDKPNERSSHVHPIIRGGGIIFLFSILFWFIQSDFQWPWFVLAVSMIAVISFLDDVTSTKAIVRFLIQLVAMLLIFYQLWPIHWHLFVLLILLIVFIGTLNAFNFMDGINGITGVYALVALITFDSIHRWIVHFTNGHLLLFVSASVVIFLFFNFRKTARCFAGDVGSVTIALVLIFVMIQLMIATNSFLWILLFLVYGIDSIVTIVYRLKRKENIFKAHRTHLFQYLSNEMRIPHLVVSSIYGLSQIIFNLILVWSYINSNSIIPIATALIYGLSYLVLRNVVIKKVQLKS